MFSMSLIYSVGDGFWHMIGRCDLPQHLVPTRKVNPASLLVYYWD